jgi:hypothetical protein
MHLKIQQHRSWIGRFAVNQLIARRMAAFSGTVLNKGTRRKMRRRLANVCAYADTVNRHKSKLSTTENPRFAQVTICILECLGVLRSGYIGRGALAIINGVISPRPPAPDVRCRLFSRDFLK